MFAEIASSAAMGSFLLYLKFKNEIAKNDADKFQRIAVNSGLKVKEGNQTRTIQLLRKTKKSWGTELAYRIPLGLSLEDFEKEKSRFQDGINNKRGEIEFKFSELKNLKLDQTIIKQLKQIFRKNNGARKEIEFSYDGVLLVKIYNEPLTNMFSFKEFDQCTGWEVPVGISRNGQIKHDFDKKAHIIVAGTTDFGKSTWVNNVIATLIKNNPNDVDFTLIDLKGGLEFSPYSNLKQVKAFATDPEEAIEALQIAVEKMEQTTEILRRKGFKNVKDASIKKRHFVIIDEAADIADNSVCQELLKSIARKGRAAGVRLVYTTQYPTSETISSQVKRNCIGRLCFVLDTATASTVVLDQGGAEKLPLIQGRALYKDVKLIEVQTPYITDEEIREVIKPQINIRARKGVSCEENASKGDTRNRDTLIIEQA